MSYVVCANYLARPGNEDRIAAVIEAMTPDLAEYGVVA